MNEKYIEWLKATEQDENLHRELVGIKDDEAEINDRFYCDLKFGTGGLRGKLGAGTNRMNVYTVARATRGLASYLCSNASKPSIAIAYDSRNMSREFAFLAADIMSGYGVKAYVFDKLTPTPVLSFAVRHLKTSAGIVITASHNPKEYNGYKVYNEHGCQITDNAAEAILSEIEKSPYFAENRPDKSLVEIIGDEVLNAFLDAIAKYSLFDPECEKTPKIVYTPLNGTGNVPVREILKRIGIKDVTVVPEQGNPDGNFPTCPYPNPEEKAALKLAVELAKKENADLVLATDPDADRVGIAVKTEDGEYRLLNGNETGVLMEDFIFSLRKKDEKIPVVVKTIVTSDMSEDIAAAYGAEVKEVLTGFKYIGETIDRLTGNEEYVFGMEESYGYLVGAHARDKDAVSAVMIIAEMATYYALQGEKLTDRLKELYEKYGYYKTSLKSISFPGEKGKADMNEKITALRNAPWREICGEKVEFKDYSLGINDLPKSNVLSFTGENIKVTVRPSGTEPKLKIYYQAKAKTESAADELLARVSEEIEREFID